VKIKSCDVRIKAAGEQDGTDDGVFEALVATWSLDSVGDKIVKGAFADTLKSWSDSGDPIPVYWSHRMDDPDYNIGTVLEAKETDEGLWVKARVDLDSPKAAQVYRLLKGRRVKQFSFAYDVEEGAWVDEKDSETGVRSGYYELRRLKLHEVGPTPIGANQATELLDVKAAELAEVVSAVKAGRVLSKTNEERVAEIARLATELLDSVQSADAESDDEKAKQEPPAARADAPDGAKQDALEQATPSPASLRLRADLEAALAGVTLTD